MFLQFDVIALEIIHFMAMLLKKSKFKSYFLEFPQTAMKKWICLPKAPICQFFRDIEWQHQE